MTRITALQIQHTREGVESEAAAIPRFQFALLPQQLTQQIRFSRFRQRQDVEQIRETTITFPQYPVGLGCHLRDQLNLAPLDKGLEDMGGAQIRLTMLPGRVVAEEVVRVQDTPAVA